MLFSSITFLYYFLPIVLLVYFMSPKKIKNAVLLLSSLVFYAWGEPKYVFLMLLTIAVNYLLGIAIGSTKGKPLSKVFMIASAVFSLGLLAYFKYAGFFAENFSRLTGIDVNFLEVALPIGISFYTFQILSYTIDVYRGDVLPQKNPITLGAYITLFPQLIAGPIVRYSDVEKTLVNRTHSIEKAAEGIRRFVTGLSKKIILANTLGELCNGFYHTTDKSVLFYWVFAVAYMLQVYFDFSGYSDMAIGIGKILGFDFSENFRYPFISKSISEFWRRWHISLGTYFRDYVYIPMGGNRVGRVRLLLNIFVVWFLTGLWHGAEWNFIVWGLYFAVLLLTEKMFFTEKLKKAGMLSHIYVLFFTLVSFVIFSASGMGEAIEHLRAMFGGNALPFASGAALYAIKNYGFVIVLSILASTPLFAKIKGAITKNKVTGALYGAIEIPALIGLVVVITAFLADGSFNPFLYFRF